MSARRRPHLSACLSPFRSAAPLLHHYNLYNSVHYEKNYLVTHPELLLLGRRPLCYSTQPKNRIQNAFSAPLPHA